MQTITVEINDRSVLKKLQLLEEKHQITIVESTDLSSPAFKGKQLSVAEFKSWIENAENSPTHSLVVAKSKWAKKRKQLQRLLK